MAFNGIPPSPKRRPIHSANPLNSPQRGSPVFDRTGAAAVVVVPDGVDAGVTLQLHRRVTTAGSGNARQPPSPASFHASRSDSITPASRQTAVGVGDVSVTLAPQMPPLRGGMPPSANSVARGFAHDTAGSSLSPLDEDDDDGDISGSISPHQRQRNGAQDVDARRIQHRYDQLRLKAEVERMEAIGQQLRHRESLLKQYYEDVTLPVNDDLGIVLGQIRAVANELGSTQLDVLVDKLETAVEDQALVLLTHMHGSNEDLIRNSEFAKGMRAIEQRRIRRKEAIERAATEDEDSPRRASMKVTRAEAEEMLKTAASASMPNARTKRVLTRGNTGSFAQHTGASGSAVTLHASGSFAGIPYRSEVDTAVSPTDYLGALPYLMAESIAKSVRCERVRVYLSTEDGLGVKHITSFPAEPASALPPALPRSLLSSVFMRGIAVSGFFSVRESADPAKVAAALAEKTSSVGAMQRIRSTLRTGAKGSSTADAAEASKNSSDASAATKNGGVPRCTLVYPIAVWSEGVKQIVGVIECIDKEMGEDEVIAPGEPPSSASANSSANGKRFTARDEELVFVATQLLGAVMERYPISAFYADASVALSSVNHPAAASTHLPIILNLDIPGAAGVGNRSLRAAPWVHIFRGPMNVVHRHSVADNKKDVQGGSMPSSNAANDLRVVEESLDCLSAMWRRAYEDNVRMHQQCRRLHDEMLEMRRVTERFEESLSAARDLASIHDIHDYLRTVELSLKSGKATDVDKAIQGGRGLAERRRSPDGSTAGGGASAAASVVPSVVSSRRNSVSPAAISHEPHHRAAASATSSPAAAAAPLAVPVAVAVDEQHQPVQHQPPPSSPRRPPRVPTAPKRQVPLYELHYDGPEDVRSYTIDPDAKRAQLTAIQVMLDSAAKAQRDAELKRLEAIPPYARPTRSASQRQDPSPYLVPAHLEMEAYGKMDVGPHHGSGGGGGAHTARGPTKVTPFRMARPK